MDWDAIGAMSESVGAIAVVITLLYLAIQIRAQTKESRLAATRELVRDSQEAIESITRDKEIFSLYLKALAAYDDLPHEERIRISMCFFRVFRVSELSYLHHLSQNIETFHFENSLVRLTDVMKSPGLQAWWENNRDSFSEDFRNYVDRIISDN
jgi:hypothetical protein